MLALTVQVGQAVQIGNGPDNGCIVKVKEKSGRRVQLVFITSLTPILLLADGLIPARFTTGVTGEPRRVPRDMAPVRAVA